MKSFKLITSRLDVENYKYGDDLAALDANQPVGSMLNARMAILSMDIELCRNSDGAITSITMDVARFSTIGLARKSPKGFMTAIQDGSHIKHYRKGSNAAMSEEDLGLVRYHIQSMTYPCTTKNDDMAWGVHDNVGHKWCFRRHRNIFIFPDKHTAVRDLQSLGYDPLAVREYVRNLSRATCLTIADNALAFARVISVTYVSSTKSSWREVMPTVAVLTLVINALRS